MEPGIVWAIIMTIIAGLEIPATLLITKHRHVEDQKDNKTIISELQGINRKIGSLPRQPSLEERETLISSVQSVIHTLSGSVHAISGMRGTVETSVTPIDPSTGEPGDKGPKYPGG